ncbi:uncharacterized protein A4U43_C08F34940 [Asparagus officinalis]|nr:uncharacterized protein A4U43_C08F34940 [Asparagus officinalis]
MRIEPGRSFPKSFTWPKIVTKKWLNMESSSADFPSDSSNHTSLGVLERRKSCSDTDKFFLVNRNYLDNSGWLVNSSQPDPSPPAPNLRVFVGTWNVGGQAPHENLPLRPTYTSSGTFQEIVPLNAGNVLGPMDKAPSATWLSLIHRALNAEPDGGGRYYLTASKQMVGILLKVILLGDLNYRLAAGYGDTRELLEKNDWQTLLERDQLRIEQRAGRVLKGWEEGKINFAPTYKYLPNTDSYAFTRAEPGDKPRTPAWCDRILWRGNGIKQISYSREESRFSDHRPVRSLFTIEIDNYDHYLSPTKIMKPAEAQANGGNNGNSGSSSCSRVQAEELLATTRTQGRLSSTRF